MFVAAAGAPCESVECILQHRTYPALNKPGELSHPRQIAKGGMLPALSAPPPVAHAPGSPPAVSPLPARPCILIPDAMPWRS